MAYADISTDVAPEYGLSVDTATGDELYRIGLFYSEGVECEKDLIAAHKWFNLAVMKGSEEAKICRQEMSDLLSTEELRSALQAARDWFRLAN